MQHVGWEICFLGKFLCAWLLWQLNSCLPAAGAAFLGDRSSNAFWQSVCEEKSHLARCESSTIMVVDPEVWVWRRLAAETALYWPDCKWIFIWAEGKRWGMLIEIDRYTDWLIGWLVRLSIHRRYCLQIGSVDLFWKSCPRVLNLFPLHKILFWLV